MPLEPTDEQRIARDQFTAGDHLVLQAGAGTGKTSTLEVLVSSAPQRRGMYLCFNKPVKEEASKRFPPHVKCVTGHGLAFRQVGYRYRHRFSGARLPAWKLAENLDLRRRLTVSERVFEPFSLAYITKQTVLRYCQSADTDISEKHVPLQRGVEDPAVHRVLATTVLPYAQRAWEDVRRPDGDRLQVEHDHYLKVWQLSQPRIESDYILLDEAQDTNPALEDVLLRQRDHAQLVLVGDSAQQIYAWRGARDIMTGFDGTHLTLSRSFRFGQRLADEANRWLALTRSPVRLSGHHTLNTRLEPAEYPNAVLCRTNGGAMAEALLLMRTGRRVAMAGGSSVLRNLALAARDLKAGRGTRHHELFLFKTWGEVQDYAENDPAGADLQTWVSLVDELGTDAVLEAVGQLAPDGQGDITVSTVHKAKGREWPTVRIGEDFAATEPEPDRQGSPGKVLSSEARLAYVAVTRARHVLDTSGLAWFNEHPQSQPAAQEPLPPPVWRTMPAQPEPPADGTAPQRHATWDDLGPAPR